jgi:hypothetical protein
MDGLDSHQKEIKKIKPKLILGFFILYLYVKNKRLHIWKIKVLDLRIY